MDQDDNIQIGITVEQINVDKAQMNNDPDMDSLAILPTKNVVLFPGVTISVVLKREISYKVAQRAADAGRPIGVVCQKDPEEDNVTLSRLYKKGVVADIIKILELPNGDRTALLHGREPFKITGVGVKAGHVPGSIVARGFVVEEFMPDDDANFRTIYKSIKRILKKILPAYNEGLSHMINNMAADEDSFVFINLVATNLPFETQEKERC